MIELAYKALDVLLGAFGGLRRVRVLVHLATRLPDGEVAYFIKIVNLSSGRDVEVTHVWVAMKPPLPLINQDRPLPVRLRPDETWETWLPFRCVPETIYSELHRLVRVQLSNGSIFKSKLNTNVPAIGYVAGPPVASVHTEDILLESSVLIPTEVANDCAVERATDRQSSISSDEIAVLQMFVELKDRHTEEDVAKRFSMTRHRAAYTLDRLKDKRYLGHGREYRNGKQVLFITRAGRDLLAEQGLL